MCQRLSLMVKYRQQCFLMGETVFLYIKAFHVISMVCWFAGIFYLPRLFVYHAMSQDTTSIERFSLMERKLYRGIMTPSMIATWGFGLWMVSFSPSLYLSQGWLHAKLLLVILLSIYHLACGKFRLKLAQNPHYKSHINCSGDFGDCQALLILFLSHQVHIRPPKRCHYLTKVRIQRCNNADHLIM